MTACIDLWKLELADDFNKDVLLSGIEHGFAITDLDVTPLSTCCTNYGSVFGSNKLQVETNIIKEITNCRYIVVSEKPLVVSSLGAVPKPNSDVRIIHDLSRPLGGINALSSDNSVTHSTIMEATSLIKPGTFLAKVDLQAAYRSVPISRDSFKLTGLQWIFEGNSVPTYMFDCRLPFGASKSCTYSSFKCYFTNVCSSWIRV